ncbi:MULTISPECIES: DHA2 family efflux MFS transporter permease subunit [unclassified Frigoribacterium]|uniref:DHA2 family efflux MFS transporter permease subunit n=1 Tax=unclassified Frigoribacterium TaxID=2627005 RepID=UPI000A5E6982|nr:MULTISPECIES: DHA2 family efflux MFS transporter permease subunit [unclassified Frigoribacterium]WAC51242.1 DHA2 family efflux MFS transporter permease subunit [Frigoribacterium sp. SL97]
MSIDPSPPTTVGDSRAPESRAADTATAGADGDQAGTEARNKLVIGLLLVSAFVVILNETIMGVALPSLTRDLDITVTAGQWLTTGFMLTMAVVIPITGFLLQRFNTRPVFITAMSLFSLGTAISAIAPGFGVLLLGRVVQASGTAIMMPLLMTTVLTLVPPATRGRTMGNISIVISVAPAIGPTISGVILSVLEWRFMFILVLPIALVALALGAARVKNVTTPKKVPLDVTSVILSAFAFGGIVFGLSSIGEGAEAAVPAWVPLAVGVVALVAFVLRQRSLQRRDRALLDLRTFSSRTFTISASVLGVGMIALFGTLIVLPIYLQNVHGLDPLATGLLLLPGGLVQGLLSPVVGRLFDKYGPTVLLVPGTTLVSAVLWFMSTVSESTPIPMVLAAHVALSIGLAFMFTPLFTSGLGSLPSNLYSHGSAIVGTVQQLAGAAGTAVFVTVMTLAATAAASQSGAGAAATGAGVRAAFLVGAIISVFAVVGSFFVRRPPVVEGAEPVVAH